jgi:thiol-disulfide isomerase/thioredoxin
MKKLITGLACMALVCFAQAEEEEHKHAISREKTLEFIGAYFGSQLPFAGADLSEKDIEHLVKGYKFGVSGEFDPASMEEFRHEIGHLMGDLVQNSKAKKDVLMMEKMSKLKVPMDMEITRSNGEKTSLAALAKGQKALFIDFWASWCGPCMANMPKLKTMAVDFKKRNVTVIGMNTEDMATAAQIGKEQSIAFDWLVEPEDRPFSKMLKIDSIPRAIILSPEGKVLYNGHPADAPAIEAVFKKAGI